MPILRSFSLDAGAPVLSRKVAAFVPRATHSRLARPGEGTGVGGGLRRGRTVSRISTDKSRSILGVFVTMRIISRARPQSMRATMPHTLDQITIEEIDAAYVIDEAGHLHGCGPRPQSHTIILTQSAKRIARAILAAERSRLAKISEP